jgi:hypothetical protein
MKQLFEVRSEYPEMPKQDQESYRLRQRWYYMQIILLKVGFGEISHV